MTNVYTREQLVESMPFDTATVHQHLPDGTHILRPMTLEEWEAHIESLVGTPIPQEEPDYTDPNVHKRVDRNRLLAESDWRVAPDATWDTTAWATYRQALRDLPADPAWPDVDFPTPPEG